MEMAVKKKMQDVREQWPGRKGKKSAARLLHLFITVVFWNHIIMSIKSMK